MSIKLLLSIKILIFSALPIYMLSNNVTNKLNFDFKMGNGKCIFNNFVLSLLIWGVSLDTKSSIQKHRTLG